MGVARHFHGAGATGQRSMVASLLSVSVVVDIHDPEAAQETYVTSRADG
jgi:hypothetical protein